jgi:hypothetical protein
MVGAVLRQQQAWFPCLHSQIPTTRGLLQLLYNAHLALRLKK